MHLVSSMDKRIHLQAKRKIKKKKNNKTFRKKPSEIDKITSRYI